MKGSFTVLNQEVEEASSSANYTGWLIFLTLDSLGCCSAKLNSDGRGKDANNPKYREGDIRSECDELMNKTIRRFQCASQSTPRKRRPF